MPAVVALRHRPRARAHDEAARGAGGGGARQGRGRDALLHGRRLARGQGRARRSTRCWRWCAACARWAWRRAARWACSTNRRRSGWPRRACPPTTTTSTRRGRTTSRSSRRARTTTGLRTLSNVRKAGITVCSGGIIGMGESLDDRCGMLATLANLDPQPESVPVNALVPVEGTPLADQTPRRRPGAGADDRDRAHPDARVARAAVGGAHGAVARGAGALLPGRARIRSSTARSCSRRATRTFRRTSRCCATPGCAPRWRMNSAHARTPARRWTPPSMAKYRRGSSRGGARRRATSCSSRGSC